jgi:MFS transporter, AAHS family, 4-hydroxybenzoate transporter
METNADGRDIKLYQLLDNQKLNRFHCKVAALCFLVIVLDGFDTTLIGFIAPALTRVWHVSRQDLGPLVSAALLGIAIGSFSAGPIADKCGRKTVLVGGVLFFAVMTLVSAVTHDLGTLTALRLLTGLGLGATIPNASTLAAEYAPLRNRAGIVTFVLCGFTIGSSAGGFASAWLIRHAGWQSVLVACGGIALLVVPLLAYALPESLHFLAAKGAPDSRVRALLAKVAGPAAFANGRLVAQKKPSCMNPVAQVLSRGLHLQSVALWTAFFMASFTVYVLVGWLPLLLTDAGFSTRDAAVTGGFFQTGGAIGVLVLGRLMDRWSPHIALTLAYAASGILIFLLGRTGGNLTWLTTLACVTGFCIAGANAGIFALSALTYPTASRATGTSWMSGVGRFGAILSGFVGAHLLGSGRNLSQVTGLLIVPIFIAALAILIKWIYVRRAGTDTPGSMLLADDAHPLQQVVSR